MRAARHCRHNRLFLSVALAKMLYVYLTLIAFFLFLFKAMRFSNAPVSVPQINISCSVGFCWLHCVSNVLSHVLWPETHRVTECRTLVIFKLWDKETLKATLLQYLLEEREWEKDVVSHVVHFFLIQMMSWPLWSSSESQIIGTSMSHRRPYIYRGCCMFHSWPCSQDI